ncbi:6,7-dimethyl-8-ribityllumazine synthase [hydrothermal vent metagenome]|uniref:6,7-dimethyl-8-ribityllumazine synthase n=1 Tax=hydrothermal vent metagenome TaxID=652676 RepID=A0A3B1D7V4_9ZZZZ
MKIIEGNIKGRGKRIAIVVSRFNDFITQRLLDACVDELLRHSISEKNITIVWVPGAYEIPMTAQKLAKKKTVQAVVCLGAVIRGETFHYELVAQGVAQGVMDVSLKAGKPIVFEVLATDTVEDANKRSKLKGDNKGRDAALVALEMIDVLRRVDDA